MFNFFSIKNLKSIMVLLLKILVYIDAPCTCFWTHLNMYSLFYYFCLFLRRLNFKKYPLLVHNILYWWVEPPYVSCNRREAINMSWNLDLLITHYISSFWNLKPMTYDLWLPTIHEPINVIKTFVKKVAAYFVFNYKIINHLINLLIKRFIYLLHNLFIYYFKRNI